MKPLLFTLLAGLLLIPSCQTTNQPLKPGMTRTGGAFAYSDMSTPGGDTTDLSLELAYGSFFTADQEIGVKVGYNDSESKSSGTKTTSTDWMLALYGRYYLATQEIILPWIELDLGWADNDVDSAFAWSVGAGITQFITNGAAIEASLDYQDFTGDMDTNGFRVLIGYALFF